MVNKTCQQCYWMLRYLASLPGTTLAILARMTREQWDWLMEKWHQATQLDRHEDCEQNANDIAKEVVHLREINRVMTEVSDLRGDVLCALLECHTYDDLYARLMDVLDDHATRD